MRIRKITISLIAILFIQIISININALENDSISLDIAEKFEEQVNDTQCAHDSFDDSFINNIQIVFDSECATMSATSDEYESVYVANINAEEIDETVYSSAPIVEQSSSLKISSSAVTGIRYSAIVSPEQRAVAEEYGLLVAVSSALDANNAELTFDLTNVAYITGVAYDKDNEIDNFNYINEDGSFVVTFAASGIPQTQHLSYLTVRSYIKYSIEGEETIVYGNTYSTSVYRTAKNVLVSSIPVEDIEYAMAVVNNIENSVSLTTSETLCLDKDFVGIINKDPDMDILSFSTISDEYYSLAFSGEGNTVFEVLKSSGDIYTPTDFGDDVSEVYLFEAGVTYYLRIKGDSYSNYTVTPELIYSNPLVWGFNETTEGYFGNYDATINGVLDSSLNVSVMKNESTNYYSQKAYIKKSNLGIDIADYSKAIIRLKNCTSADKIQGYFQIDSDYSGSNSSSWYQPIQNMTANATGYIDYIFDLTGKSGELNSIMIGFGMPSQELSGNIYIDSIALLPMPKNYGWEFSMNRENWGTNSNVTSSSVVDGKYWLEIADNGGDAAVYSPENIGVSAKPYNKIQIGLKNLTNARKMHVYYTTYNEGDTAFSTDRCVTIDIRANYEGFLEYTVDLSEEVAWSGVFKRLMLVFPESGSVVIDYVRFANFELEYDDIIWDFNDNTVQGFTTSDYGTGIFQHQIHAEQGSLIVERISAGSGGLFTPFPLSVPTDEYRYLVLGVKSATANAEFRTYFETSGTYYSEDNETYKYINTRSVQIEKSNEFKEYIIDLSSAESGWISNYNGTLISLMFSLRSSGTFEFDYIMLLSDNELLEHSIESNVLLYDDSIHLSIPYNNSINVLLFDDDGKRIQNVVASPIGGVIEAIIPIENILGHYNIVLRDNQTTVAVYELDCANTEKTFNTSFNSYISLPVSVSNTYSLSNVAFLVVYDEEALEMIDACEHTHTVTESGVGIVSVAEVSILAIDDGIVTFKSVKELTRRWSGTVNTIKFKPVIPGTSTISIYVYRVTRGV